MELKEIVAPTMKELFKNELIRQILSGECKIDDRLPTEREMERKMKVSRTVINSALSELSKLGFVKIVPRHGVFVNDYIRNGNVETLIAIMKFNGGKLDRKTFDSFTDYRLHNECECAFLAACNRSNEDLVILRNLYEAILASEDVLEVSQLKLDFHHAIYCATGNRIYPLVFNSFNKFAFTFNEVLFRNLGCHSAGRDLPELLDAIENKDAEKARSVMGRLISSRIEELNLYYFND